MNTWELRLHSRFVSLERAYRGRWFSCAALIAIICAQTALAILIVPDEFGAAPVRRKQHSTISPAAGSDQTPRSVQHESHSVIPTGPRKPRSVPPRESPLPVPEDLRSPEPSAVGSATIPYAPAPSTTGQNDARASPVPSIALVAASPTAQPVPSGVSSAPTTPRD